jgi:hypothetical protein
MLYFGPADTHLEAHYTNLQLVWAVYPETANRHLEDIDRMYRENKSLVFVFKNKEAIQVERPQRFNDLNSARRDQLEDTSPMEGRDEKLPSKLEA